MLEIKLKPLMTASEMLSSVAHIIRMERSGGAPSGIFNNDSYVEMLIEQIKNIRSEMDNLQMGGVSVFAALDRLESRITVGGDEQLVLQYITEFKKILHDELSGTFVLTLSHMEKRLFTQSEPLFGADVKDKFHSLAYEIDEIGKCLALSRSTAAAFHMLRCLEAAMRAVARCLGIPDPIKGTDRNWGNALKAMVAEIDSRWPKGTRISGDGVLFERYHATLQAIANPYRNATMHLEDKYTEEEARSLLEIVRGFLQSVAKRMDEDGNPKA